MKQTCTTKDAANILGVTPRTIQLWSDAGVLDYWKTPGGHRRYDREVIEAFTVNKDLTKEFVNPQDENCRVLVIEDDGLLLNLYNININSWGLPIDLELSQDGYDGLLKIGLFKPDVLILDLSLPSVDGFQIIGTLLKNKLLLTMQLIVVTGLSKTEINHNLGQLQDIQIMKKPVDFTTIRSIIETKLLQTSKAS